LAIYSIKDLEKLSGIKAHTLRIWEKRYKIISPQRTDTNIRYYLDEDLKRLLNIALLNRFGVKISRIADMSDEEITLQVSSISDRINESESQLDALTISMIEMDEVKFHKIINQKTELLGFERTMMEVIYPFLDKLSVLWFTGSINAAQENFMANLIKQKIYVAIEQLEIDASSDQKKVLLYLPEGESQELSLLFIQYLFRERQFCVVNIGGGIKFEDLRGAYEIHHPDYIFTIINEPRLRQSIQDYVNKISDFFSESVIILSGFQVIQNNMKSNKNYLIMHSLEDLFSTLNRDELPEMPGESHRRGN
jgi:DNA-binding transcriptional MerR regulator